jgi:hypothetical protein
MGKASPVSPPAGENTMRYMTFVKSSLGSQHLMPPPALMHAIAELGMEAGAAGVFVEMGGLMPIERGGSVAVRKGAVHTTDGPYAEAREVVGGWAVYDVPTREDAMHWARKFMQLHATHWPEWEGECEVREIMGQPPR